MESVDAEKQEYKDMKPSWKKIRDCVGGERLIKGDDVAKTYLPEPNPLDKDANKYAAYKLRAVFYNTTDKTINGLAGAVLRKPPKVDLPTELEYMKTDCDGEGSSIQQFSKEVLYEILEVGRCGLLTDFPRIAEQPITLEREQEMALRSSLLLYKAENIINWRKKKIGAEIILSLVVIKEDVTSKVNQFEDVTQTLYRVLSLDDTGLYYQEVYAKSDEKEGKGGFFLVEDRVYPKDKEGRLLNRIPFVFVGPKTLKPDVEKPPLLDIVDVNLGHYRNSADFEQMVFMAGQPTLLLTGLTKGWITAVFNDKPLVVGSRSSVQLPVGGDGKYLQISESQVANLAMVRKEEQMVALGARVITNVKGGVEAADTVRMRSSGEASILSNVADNVGEAVTISLRYATIFMGGNVDDVVFEMNDDFFAETISLEEAKTIIQLWQSGVVAKPDVRDLFRKGELIRADREDEDIDADLEQEEGENPSLDLDSEATTP